MQMQEDLNFEFDWTYKPGDWSARNTFMQEIKTANETVGGGAAPYDAVVTYNLSPYLFATNGLAENIYGHKYLDLSKEWWPQTLTNEILLNDTLYAVVENNDYGVLRNIMCMFFNNDMLKAKNMADPYQLVADNEWTMATFTEMIKDAYEDKNGNDKVETDSDVFGYCGATKAKKDCWFYSLGCRYTEVKDNVVIDLTPDPNGKIEAFIDVMRDLYDMTAVQQYDTKQDKMFKEERAVFYSTGLFITEEIVNENLSINYGVVPIPMMNKEQGRYYTMTHNTHDAWMVPINSTNIDDVCAIMELSAYYAWENIGPMYFDTYVKLRYAPDERLSEMYDLIRESITFDFGYLFKATYDSVGGSAPASVVSTLTGQPNGESWAATYDSYDDLWTKALSTFAAIYSTETN